MPSANHIPKEHILTSEELNAVHAKFRASPYKIGDMIGKGLAFPKDVELGGTWKFEKGRNPVRVL